MALAVGWRGAGGEQRGEQRGRAAGARRAPSSVGGGGSARAWRGVGRRVQQGRPCPYDQRVRERCVSDRRHMTIDVQSGR